MATTDKHKDEILSAAQVISKNCYYLPTESMSIRLRDGVQLSDWVEKWITHRYKNLTDDTLWNE